MKNYSQGKLKLFANVLEDVDIARFISMFFQTIRVMTVTLCCTADELKSMESIISQGKVKENVN